MDFSKISFDEAFIKKNLRPFEDPERKCLKGKSFVNSAVVVLIEPHDSKSYDLVLILRTERDSDKHSGDMAFPGGVFEPNVDKTFFDTALRELSEELGVRSNNINILGCLNDHITPKKYIITPFIGQITASQKMIKEESEVEEVVKVPISFFMDKNNYRERTYLLNGDTLAVGTYNYKDPRGKRYKIYGATCHIIVSFIEQVYQVKLMDLKARRLTCSDLEGTS